MIHINGIERINVINNFFLLLATNQFPVSFAFICFLEAELVTYMKRSNFLGNIKLGKAPFNTKYNNIAWFLY